MTAYEMYQHVLGGVVFATFSYALIEAVMNKTRWM